MWRTVVTSLVLLTVVGLRVKTAPAYPQPLGINTALKDMQEMMLEAVRGTHYTISNPEGRHKPYIEARNATFHGSGPREEARAMCSVKTQEVNATANATITRRLHGVVTSRELHSSIQRLEVIIFGQMQQLWQSLDALRTQLAGNSRTHYPDRRSVVFHFKPDMG